MPALRAGGISGSEDWFITEMKPGACPLEELELAILSVAVIQPPSLLGQIKEDKRGLLRAVRRVLPERSELILVIDQLEELYTLVRDPEDSNFFLESIYEAVCNPQSPLRVLITLRADYYDRPLRHPEFSSLMERRTQVVKPLTGSELEQAISEPTAKVGVTFDSGLAPMIVREVHEEPGALPLLQYALTELFDRCEGRTITRAEYENIGGVRGALARRAEDVYSGLDEAGQEAARQLFLRLVTLGEGEEDSRRRVLLSEVKMLHGTASPEVMDDFGKARLLTFDHDPLTREPTLEVAHEALLQEWGRLREWLDESRADIRLQRVLGNAAEEWQSADRDPGFLLRGSRLDQFEGWAGTAGISLTQLEVDYLEASLAERRERELLEIERLEHEAALERRSRNFLRILVAVLAVAAIGAVILSGVAFNQRGIAQNSAATAAFAQGQALTEAATAVAAQEEAQQLAAAEAQARLEAEDARRISTANELVAFAKSELDDPNDVSYSLALLLAQEAVLTTMNVGEPATPGAEDALRQAITAAPIQHIIFEGHSRSVNYASWSPDGMLIATASDDGTARTWDAQSGEELLVFHGHSGGVNHTSWSPDGKYILTSGDDRSVSMWNVDSGEEVISFEGHNEIVGTANWSADGTQILSASTHEINLWEARSGELIFEKTLYPRREWAFQHGFLNYAQFNPMGDQIATQYGNTMVIINSKTGEEIFQVKHSFGYSNSADWSSDGNLLLTAHDLKSAIVWDTQANEPVMDLRHNAEVERAT